MDISLIFRDILSFVAEEKEFATKNGSNFDKLGFGLSKDLAPFTFSEDHPEDVEADEALVFVPGYFASAKPLAEVKDRMATAINRVLTYSALIEATKALERGIARRKKGIPDSQAFCEGVVLHDDGTIASYCAEYAKDEANPDNGDIVIVYPGFGLGKGDLAEEVIKAVAKAVIG